MKTKTFNKGLQAKKKKKKKKKRITQQPTKSFYDQARREIYSCHPPLKRFQSLKQKKKNKANTKTKMNKISLL